MFIHKKTWAGYQNCWRDFSAHSAGIKHMPMITKKRTPTELAKFVEEYKSQVDNHDLGNGLLRKGKYKFFIDEVYPLSKFCTAALDDNHEIEPVKGNQGYDAKVFLNGAHQYNIEITIPHDGKLRAANTRSLIKNGISPLKISSPDDLKDIEGVILKTCTSKAQKDYSDSVLVIYIHTGGIHSNQHSEFKSGIESIFNAAKTFKYKAKGVYLYFSPFNELRDINT